jgi:diadenosine tetraphosphate (Ap4A) HIT family hydrolase
VAAEQTVFHLHLHIIPRWDNDGIKLAPEPKTTDVDLAELAKMIGENI